MIYILYNTEGVAMGKTTNELYADEWAYYHDGYYIIKKI